MERTPEVLLFELPPPITGRQFVLLKKVAEDCKQLGRIRTSSEVHGLNTAQRAELLGRLLELEEKGLIARRGKGAAWSTGHVTQIGYDAIKFGGPPIRLRPVGSFPKGISADGGTRFVNRLFGAGEMNILAHGSRNAKLGAEVLKGRYKGLPIYTVTLEEGRTCALECTLRDRCYGGGMHRAKRIRWDGEETGVAVAEAITNHPGIFLRLHTLGDFPSVEYVDRVFAAVTQSEGSAAFGFSHYQRETPVGERVAELSRQNWGRFAIRTSYEHGKHAPIPERSAVIISHPDQAKLHNAVICPEQLGKTKSCGSCGFCWHSQRPVAFLLHEVKKQFKKGESRPPP